ncbi:MAG: 50S ribosomal protein L14e [Nanoarchaeota archaeon]
MIGRICLKLTGREAGNYCVIVNNLDNNFVLIDGNVKRRKCNMDHLELTDKVVEIKKDASKDEVLNAMSKAGIKVNKKELRRPKKENAKTKK